MAQECMSGSEWLGPELIDFDEVQNFVAISGWNRLVIVVFQYLADRHRASFRAWKWHALQALLRSQNPTLDRAHRIYWHRRTGVDALLNVQYQ